MNKNALLDYRALLLEIDLLEEERQKLIGAILMPQRIYDGPKVKGGYCDPVGETASKLADIRSLLDKKLDKLINTRQKIDKSLDNISAEARNLLTMRYLLGYTWDEMADKMHFTYQWIFMLSKRAMQEWEAQNVCTQNDLQRA